MPIQRVIRDSTPAERARHAEIREAVERVHPPLQPSRSPSPQGRIALSIARGRTAHGLSHDELAAQAGLADGAVVRDIEFGDDGKVSDVIAILTALGLSLDVIEVPA